MNSNYTTEKVDFILSDELEDAVLAWILKHKETPEKKNRIYFYHLKTKIEVEYLKGEGQADLEVVEALLKTLTEIEKKNLLTQQP